MHKKLKSDLLLILTALIWGSAFVAQRAGMEQVQPFTFNACRSVLACAALAVVIAVMRRGRRAGGASCQEQAVRDPADSDQAASDTGILAVCRKNKTLLLGGILCGIALFTATSFQQFGMVTTEAGKAGFITALYIVLVPVLGLFIGKKIRPVIWICVILSIIGLWLLTIKNGFSIEGGDVLVLICAFFFAVHILIIDHFSPRVDGVVMSMIQFIVCTILSFICMFIFEAPSMGAILNVWLPIVYAGVMSSGIAYTLQILAQKNADPAVASLLLSLESVFSVLAGWVILGEQLSPKELTGCAIMFFAVILSQLPQSNRMKGRN